MTLLKALIIDDEPFAHKVILQYAEDIPFLEIVGQCYLATEAYSMLNEKAIDLLFLDIQMPKLKGLDFIRTLDHKPQIIITSAFEEYALEGFELQVCDYLLKPFPFDRFLKAIHKTHQQISLLKQEDSSKPPEMQTADDRIFIKVDKRFIQLNLQDIQYFESYGNYVKIWIASEMYLTPRTLSSFEKELNDSTFMRIHKSYIIQKAYIDYVEGNRMVMKNGTQLTIGKSYRQEVKQWLS
ncbi:MAG: DNA-binding response regulator [Saprospiraceae bacterium]|nr:MAG: DNA-binding response regulator [Saprospiraceae bacterium]